MPETKAALCSVHQITQLHVTKCPVPVREVTLVFSREDCSVPAWVARNLEQLLEHGQSMMVHSPPAGKSRAGIPHPCEVPIDNWSLLEKELWTPTNIPYLFRTPKATNVMKGWNFPCFSYFRVHECREQMLPDTSHVVSISGPQILGFRFPLNSSSTIWQSGTQQAPKKMTSVDRYATEIRSADTVYLSIQALCDFNTQAFKSHIHHVQCKTEYLLLCAPHSVYRESIPTSITFREIEPICKCWASISVQWPELQ